MNFDIFDHLMSNSIGKPYGEWPPHFIVSSQLFRMICAGPREQAGMRVHKNPWLAN